MATIKLACKRLRQCRFLVLYFVLSMFLIIWIYGMNYGMFENNHGDSDMKLEIMRGGLHTFIKPKINHATEGFRSPGSTCSAKTDAYLKRLMDERAYCDGQFIGYGGKFAKLSPVLIDPQFGHGKRGGENISEVLNQPENSEYYSLKPGYFRVNCKEKFKYGFQTKGHMNGWMGSVGVTDRALSSGEGFKQQTNWVVAVLRYEYANLYHTMTDFYNAFLLTQVFNMDIGNITVLWIDGHPIGALDDTWKVLFGQVARASDINTPVLFDKLVWNIVGYDSPMNDHSLPFVPCLEDFREFFLSRHGLSTDHKLDCANMSVLFLWRRDYVAHPRNPSGKVSRKIQNEDELLSGVKNLLPGHNVQGIQMDALPMQRQLEIITKTDILIGMHGAGLAHTLFLPKHGGLVEFYPTYWPSANKHFRVMAQWRHLTYSTWINTDHSRELPNHYTVIDVKAAVNIVHEMHHKLCEGKVH